VLGPGDDAAVVVRRLPATPEEVFDEWTDADALLEWMCPRPTRATRVVCDARVGGTLRFDVDDDGTALVIQGRFLVLDRPRRIQFTWNCTAWEPPAADSVVTVTLEPHGDDETTMTIHHAQLPPDVVDRHRQGWTACAAQLETAVARPR